ncbi:MAG TPA: HipA domain-containing protein [Gammaproteobacteria bacterium]|nr:HipA domain-containing protein [Gammaproteobacteria bacterium]
MKRCPITYEVIPNDENYSKRGLHQLSPQLKNLKPLNLSADEQRKEAVNRAVKMSIQGIQTKLSARLNIKKECFEIVDQQGHYILKPQNEYYPELPQNEALTMSLAKIIGLEVPVHGLIYSKDNSLTYFIKRFDRVGHHKKLAVEDFAQLSGADRHTKYESSMENVANIIEKYCSFPKIEFVKLLKLTLFNFIVGNEDMHLKNFSLITRNHKVTLSPVYDLVNSTIAYKTKEELALPLDGRKNNLTKQKFLKYFAIERLGLNQDVIAGVLQELQQAVPRWQTLINESFLSQKMQDKYIHLLKERLSRIFHDGYIS